MRETRAAPITVERIRTFLTVTGFLFWLYLHSFLVRSSSSSSFKFLLCLNSKRKEWRGKEDGGFGWRGREAEREVAGSSALFSVILEAVR